MPCKRMELNNLSRQILCFRNGAANIIRTSLSLNIKKTQPINSPYKLNRTWKIILTFFWLWTICCFYFFFFWLKNSELKSRHRSAYQLFSYNSYVYRSVFFISFVWSKEFHRARQSQSSIVEISQNRIQWNSERHKFQFH